MKKSLLFLVSLFLLSQHLTAQNSNLLTSIKNSGNAQIYELTDENAYEMYKRPGATRVEEHHLKNWFCAVPIDSNIYDHLPPGHYMKVYTVENKLLAEVFSVTDFIIETANNQADLFIKLWRDGKPLEYAQLKLRGSRIRYRPGLQGYWKRKTNASGLLEVSIDGRKWYFNIVKDFKNSRFKRIKRKIVYGTPLKFVVTPVVFVVELPIHGYKSIKKGYAYGNIGRVRQFGVRTYKKIACKFDYAYCHGSFKDKFKGYAITNQPKYRKGDTVRFKALNLNKKGKPSGKKPLNIYVKEYWRKHKLIDTVEPYRKGAFTYDLVLHDSLELKLDKRYTLAVGKKPGRIVKDASFFVEDYELKSITLKLRTVGNTIYPGSNFTIYAEGKDENDLTLPDGRITLYALPGVIHSPLENETFVPDTLWTYTGPLKTEGETSIVFPDSIMPNANMNIKLIAELRNTENEFTSKIQTLKFLTGKKVTGTLLRDSLLVDYLENGKSRPARGSLIVDNDTSALVQFPVRFKVNPLIQRYAAVIAGHTYALSQADFRPSINVATSRGNDSLVFQVQNPADIPFTYFIYKTNRLIHKGHTRRLNYRVDKPGNAKYYMSLQYAWGDQVFTDDYQVDNVKKRINITTDLPAKGYPGMKTGVMIKVTDEIGRPVKNADITAFSLTKKFKYDPPKLESFTRQQRRFRHLINRFDVTHFDTKVQRQLNYMYWKDRLGLDSIAYYHFLYPKKSYYQYTSPTESGSTVFSPFVVQNGQLITAKIVYLDHRPIYFAWNTIKDPYAFEAQAGYHKIKVRTDSLELSLDSVYLQKGMKTVLSIPTTGNAKVKITRLEPKLSDKEKNNLHRYILPYRKIGTGNVFGYIRQGNRYFQVAPTTSRTHYLTGPIKYGHAYLQQLEGYGLAFNHEQGFEYDFSPKVIKMRSFFNYPKILWNTSAPQSLHDLPMSYETIETRKREYDEAQRRASRVYKNPGRTKAGNSTLRIIHHKKTGRNKIINTLLFKLDDPDFVRVYAGNTENFHDLGSGYYKLIFFHTDRSYFSADSLRVNKGGQHFHKIPLANIHPADSFSTEVDRIMNEVVEQRSILRSQKKTINRAYRTRYSYSGVGRNYSGIVRGSDGEPLPGVSVIIKGTTYGTVTKLDGHYNLYGPYDATLIFSFIGFTNKEINTARQPVLDVDMIEDIQRLEEVVVIGYGIETKKQALGYSVSISNALGGKAAGISIVNGEIIKPKSMIGEIRIRGNTSLGPGNTPLIVVNGEIFEGDLDESLIDNIQVLKSEAATALYGSRAVGGVIIITTKEYKQLTNITPIESLAPLPPQNTIRKNFKDHALWAPGVRSDAEGIATIQLHLPGDITNWETHILAYGKGKRTGQLKVNTQSYLPISARLALPRFLLAGDSVMVLGKVSNYTGVPQDVRSTFFQEDKVIKEGRYLVETSATDSLLISPVQGSDTLNITYTIQNDSGFSDGEQREVPVFEQGITIAQGYSWSLDMDTVFTVNFPDSLGPVRLYASADLDNVFLEEIKYLIKYPYQCNEQLASKLMAIGVYNEIKKSLGEKEHYKARAQQIIKTLQSRQSPKGYWAWWSEGSFEPWVTEHIIEAAHLTQSMVKKPLPFDNLIEHALWELDMPLNPTKKLSLIRILNRLDSTFDVKPYILDVKSNWDRLSTLNKFSLWRLEQEVGSAVSQDSIMAYAHFDSYGNLSFDSRQEKQRQLFYQSNIFLTLKGYELLHHMNEKTLTRKIVNYLLKKRQAGHWRNTYESAKVIYTLRHEIGQINKEPSSLELPGITNQPITRFPFDYESTEGGLLTVKKTGTGPIYLAAHQETRLRDPKVNEKHFIVKTSYSKVDGATLKAGEVIDMSIQFQAKKDAEYLVLDVPIPASCTYVDKGKGYLETHREYYRNKVSYFFKTLRRGEYELKIKLIPRFEGSFTQSPAQAHWMYFPTVAGWNESKRVSVLRGEL